MKMARHLEACHADEHEITSLPEKSKSSSDIRNKTFEKLSKLGNFHQNINALTKKSGNLLIGKRAKTRAKKLKNTYDANFVWFFFLSSDLWRHTYQNLQVTEIPPIMHTWQKRKPTRSSPVVLCCWRVEMTIAKLYGGTKSPVSVSDKKLQPIEITLFITFVFMTYHKKSLLSSDIHYLWYGKDFEGVISLKFIHFHKKFVA